jgi:6,7-dimethyl-8-ribityllumazine synthase
MVKVRIGAVVSEFNYDITQMMLELAKEHAKFLDSEITDIIAVPGVFDMPLAIKKLLDDDEIDAVVTLGAVIEGSTSHDEIVVQHASRKIADLALEYNKPVALGITGPGMTPTRSPPAS